MSNNFEKQEELQMTYFDSHFSDIYFKVGLDETLGYLASISDAEQVQTNQSEKSKNARLIFFLLKSAALHFYCKNCESLNDLEHLVGLFTKIASKTTDRSKINNLNHILDISAFLTRSLVKLGKNNDNLIDMERLSMDLIDCLRTQFLYLYKEEKRPQKNIEGSNNKLFAAKIPSSSSKKSSRHISRKKYTQINQIDSDEDKVDFWRNNPFSTQPKMNKSSNAPSLEEIKEFVEYRAKTDSVSIFTILNPFLIDISTLCRTFPNFLSTGENMRLLEHDFTEWQILIESPEVLWLETGRRSFGAITNYKSGQNNTKQDIFDSVMPSIRCLSCTNISNTLINLKQHKIYTKDLNLESHSVTANEDKIGSIIADDHNYQKLIRNFDVSTSNRTIFGTDLLQNNSKFLPVMKFYENLMEITMHRENNEFTSSTFEKIKFYLESILSHAQSFTENIPESCLNSVTFQPRFSDSLEEEMDTFSNIPKVSALYYLKLRKMDEKTSKVTKALELSGKNLDSNMRENLDRLLKKFDDHLHTKEGHRDILNEYKKVSEVQVQAIKRYRIFRAIANLRAQTDSVGAETCYPNVDLFIESIEHRILKINEILHEKKHVLNQNMKDNILNSKNVVNYIRVGSFQEKIDVQSSSSKKHEENVIQTKNPESDNMADNEKNSQHDEDENPIDNTISPEEEKLPTTQESVGQVENVMEEEVPIMEETLIENQENEQMIAEEITKIDSIETPKKQGKNVAGPSSIGNLEKTPDKPEEKRMKSDEQAQEPKLESAGVPVPKRGKKSSGGSGKTNITLNPVNLGDQKNSKMSKKSSKNSSNNKRSKKSKHSSRENTPNNSVFETLKNSLYNQAATTLNNFSSNFRNKRGGTNMETVIFKPNIQEIRFFNNIEQYLLTERISSLDLSAYQFDALVENIQNTLADRLIQIEIYKGTGEGAKLFDDLFMHLRHYANHYVNDGNYDFCNRLLCKTLETCIFSISKVYSNIKFTDLLNLLDMTSDPIDVIDRLKSIKANGILDYTFSTGPDLNFLGNSEQYERCVVYFQKINKKGLYVDLGKMQNLLSSYDQIRCLNGKNVDLKAAMLSGSGPYVF